MPFMKKLLLTILFGISISSVFGQELNEVKYQFAKDIFNSEKYTKTDYQRFSDKIELIENDTYKFGDKLLKVEIDNEHFRKIFEKGIFNPDVIFGKETTKKTKTEPDTLSQNQKVLYNLTRNDSIAVCCIEELEKLNPNPQTKRFKFWVLRIGIANPTEYYLELYNNKATKETSFEDFIEDSEMTFYYKGTLII
jgi:hypothetical protein